jgi:hypothetical protein
MIAFEDFKQLLGKAAEGLSDDEIRVIEGQAHGLAATLFEYWRQRRPLNLRVDDSRQKST